MKVEIFSDSYTGESIQNKINKWLDEKKPEVKFIHQSECVNDEGFNITISVWYED